MREKSHTAVVHDMIHFMVDCNYKAKNYRKEMIVDRVRRRSPAGFWTASALSRLNLRINALGKV